MYANGVVVTATGGSIANNEATAAGGGVYCRYQSIKVSGNPVISGNKAGDSENSVASNEVSAAGGGVYCLYQSIKISVGPAK